MMLYITGKMMLIFLFHLQFGLPIFQLYTFAMQLVDQHISAWFIVRINSQHGQSEIPCNNMQYKVFEAFLSWLVCISKLQHVATKKVVLKIVIKYKHHNYKVSLRSYAPFENTSLKLRPPNARW